MIFFLTEGKKALIYYVDLPMMNKIADCPVTLLVIRSYLEEGHASRAKDVNLFPKDS